MIIDTHCHLDDKRYNRDVDEVITRAKERGTVGFIIPGANPKTLKMAVKLSEQYDEVYFAVGVHPYHARDLDIEYLKKYIQHPKSIAVGECGLDYYRLPNSKEEIMEEKRLQKKVFIEQIELANEFNLPLIVHIRDSSKDSLEILEKYAGKRGGVIHCYGGDESLLKLSKRGFYYGIGGVITFQNAKKLIRAYPKIPLDRLMVETDAPYLTPHPHRGKRNEPSYCEHIISEMARLSNMERGKLEVIVMKNVKKLFFSSPIGYDGIKKNL